MANKAGNRRVGTAAKDDDAAAAAQQPKILTLSAVTLATRDMARAVRFYEALGFPLKYGGPSETFTSFEFGGTFLNLIADARAPAAWWGRVIVYVSDVDRLYRKALAAGLEPEFAPLDAPWGERYFHIVDPDGHEISFARPLG
ncbi:glyoxalase/bleomycin resistance protein/dioxygenase superfamily protein [Trinickia symbiotica]|uniref:Glyoxalase/bleomycin resistance/dioxygenase family protein n=1 Tax=Trinickia symbiotica TaxID=863227 RepID=A0A2N7X8P7_9BURK|nr:VOC family protein [Trinickia symbiotica]PMS38123.1 glyoxalase/bleomycin resistance/dioxygenase family protein [Trinickia symbiotica]PPK47199.1 glyoxalase/bleomycin resistance protein/dioxygenase superfamily protein [Trinickia symbiotica]